MEVKIGVTDSPRELVFNSAQTPGEVEKLVTDALSTDSGVLTLTDDKGRRFLVQTNRIAYVEIGAADVRRVGFGVGAVGAEAVKGGTGKGGTTKSGTTKGGATKSGSVKERAIKNG